MATFKFDETLGTVVPYESKKKLKRRHDVNAGESLPERFSRVEDEEAYNNTLDEIFGQNRVPVRGKWVYKVIDGQGTMLKVGE